MIIFTRKVFLKIYSSATSTTEALVWSELNLRSALQPLVRKMSLASSLTTKDSQSVSNVAWAASTACSLLSPRALPSLLNSSSKLCIELLRTYWSCFTYFVTGRLCQQGSISFIVQIVLKHEKIPAGMDTIISDKLRSQILNDHG